jgi:hypothetical protein
MTATSATKTERDRLRERIARRLQKLGYVPPLRDLARDAGCSLTTAWRMVRELGWAANYRHRWVRVKRKKKE